MGNLLGIIQDDTGQLSSTRVGKMIMIGCWAFQSVMHVLEPATNPAPEWTITAAVLTICGISTAQNKIEKSKNGGPSK